MADRPSQGPDPSGDAERPLETLRRRKRAREGSQPPAAALVYLPPLHGFFGTAALTPGQLATVAPLPFIVWDADEIRRTLIRRRHQAHAAAKGDFRPSPVRLLAAMLGACSTGGDGAMKLITAIVKPEKLDDVTRAVTDAGARGMTVTEVRGFGQQYGRVIAVHPADREVLMLPKLRIDVAVEDRMTGLVVDAIAKSANTGAVGDGKVWVCPLESALRVRTGERDRDAL